MQRATAPVDETAATIENPRLMSTLTAVIEAQSRNGRTWESKQKATMGGCDMAQVRRSFSVVISGAGPCGLLASILLAREGVKSIVVEKRNGVGTLPRARGITARSV